MMSGSTLDMRPKSRKTRRPSSSSMMLPSCGSACTKPVRTSEAVHASTAMRVMRRPCSAGSAERCAPCTHSVTRTLVVEYCGTGLGVVTKPRKSSDASKASAFSASRL